jgi:hypothetical protein
MVVIMIAELPVRSRLGATMNLSTAYSGLLVQFMN